MKNAEKYNKKANKFTYQMPENAGFYSLKDVYANDKNALPLKLRGLYINTKSKFGKQAIALTDNYYVTLPNHLICVVEDMLKDDDFINAVNSSLVYFDIEKYYSKRYNKECYNVTWIDME